MIVSTLSMTTLLLMSHKGYTKLAWSWLIVVGTIETLILSYLFGYIKSRAGSSSD